MVHLYPSFAASALDNSKHPTEPGRCWALVQARSADCSLTNRGCMVIFGKARHVPIETMEMKIELRWRPLIVPEASIVEAVGTPNSVVEVGEPC